MQEIDPLLAAVAGALATVSSVLLFELRGRAKRAEDKVDRYEQLIPSIAESVKEIKDYLLKSRAH